MGQDRDTGSAANEYGRRTGRKIALLLGATMLNGNSNECTLGKRRLVIKCARKRTTQIGVCNDMLERIDFVIAACEIDVNKYELYQLSAEQYRDNMKPTASKGSSAGRVSMVNTHIFKSEGTHISRYCIIR